jgi:hypothetical protein
VDAIPVQRDDDDRLPAMVLLPVLAYAERFPTLPVFSIVQCLLDAWRDASLTYIDDDWMGSFDRLATERLNTLVTIDLTDGVRVRRRTARRERLG